MPFPGPYLFLFVILEKKNKMETKHIVKQQGTVTAAFNLFQAFICAFELLPIIRPTVNIAVVFVY